MTYADARLVAEEKIVKATRNSERMDVGGAVAKRMEELQRSVDPTVMAIQKIDSVTQNMNSAIDKFVDTGKFSFADFSRSIIQDIIKIELKAQATKLFSSLISTGGSFLSGLLGFAGGGNPPVNKPSIVGENGPELFVPKTAGTIVPNGGSVANAAQGNTYITNNISAIDAKSVAQLFAENRKTLFGSVQMAQKELSYGR
jgi:phage-related minor tail protein